jgi:tRNA pseudouridine38-40 synthase
MRTLKLTVAYDGTRFVGWQRQAEGESIQGLLEGVLARIEGAPVSVQGAGRTDAGVHALGQVASVRVACPHDTATLTRAINAQLPCEVRVLSIDEAEDAFHARFNARSKHYRYQIERRPIASPFDRAYAWHVPEPLNLEAMRTSAAALVGTHDFRAFQSSGGATRVTIRTVTRSELTIGNPVEATQAPALLVYEVAGDGFLRHMVRAIVGTLVEVGRGQRTPESVASLVGGGSRGDAGRTAPAHGLFLVRVVYDQVLMGSGDTACRVTSC